MDSSGLDSRERGDDFIRDHNGTGVVWEIDIESGVHFFIRVIRGRVSYQRHLVAKLSGITHRCLHARVCDEPDDDEFVDAMLFELHIQIRVGKATGTPMLLGHDIARLRLELAANLATPGAVFEGLMPPGRLLDRRNVLPGLVVAWTVTTMQRIEDAQRRLPRRMQDL